MVGDLLDLKSMHGVIAGCDDVFRHVGFGCLSYPWILLYKPNFPSPAVGESGHSSRAAPAETEQPASVARN
jgi:hypothetical protein